MPTGILATVNSSEIVKMYQSGLSCNEIAQQIGYSETVVSRQLRLAGIPKRSHGEAGKLRFAHFEHPLKRVKFTCPQCSKVMMLAPERAHKRKYCSRKCAGMARTEHGMPHLRLERPTLVCKNCQEEFQVKDHYQAKTQQFCSSACARYYQHMTNRRWANTTIERIVQALLAGMNIDFVSQWRLDGFSADIYLPDRNMAIECDGKYWHALPLTRRSDLKKERAFSEANIPVLHLVEDEIMNDIHLCKTKVLEFLGPGRTL